MPGPVSDALDAEWGTADNAEALRTAIKVMHMNLGTVIGSPPKPILDVVSSEAGPTIVARFSERQWRILRFACERAAESV